MGLKALSGGVFLAQELVGFTCPPEWRKATRAMIMATASLERAWEKVSKQLGANREALGLIVGSNSGELDTSAEFLITWSKQKMARPLLFQNSLHNAMAGFASIHLQLSGPTFTVSSLNQTPQDCLTLAETLIASGTCVYCLVTLVESHQMLAGMIGETEIKEGACTLVVSAGDDKRLKGANQYPENRSIAPLVAIDSSRFFALAMELQ